MQRHRLRDWILAGLVPVIFIGAGTAAVKWLRDYHRVPRAVPLRVAGTDGRPQAGPVEETAQITGELLQFEGTASDLPGDWPRFRGENYDAVSPQAIVGPGPAAGDLQELWTLPVGEGFAGPAIWDGRVYLMDYDRDRQADAIRCFSLDDGREIWRYTYPIEIKRFHGMTRTVPAIAQGFLVTMGPKCHVTCLNAETGRFRWMLNLVRDFGTRVPQWYTAQCPVIDRGRAIIAPAGDVLMMAVDCNSGDVVWQTPNPDQWVMTHSSVVPMDFAGKRMYVYCGGSTDRGGIVGVDAETGQVLWQTDTWRVRTNVPMPVVVGEDRLFVCAGYGQTQYGCAMLRLHRVQDAITVETEFLHNTEVFGSMQQTPILYEDHIYGVGMDKQLACLDLTGRVLWRSGSDHTFGYGGYMLAGRTLILLDDSGVLSLVSASPEGYQPVLQTPVFADGVECWGPPALASGRLIVRDLTRLKCIKMGNE